MPRGDARPIFREKNSNNFENGPPTVVADCPWQDTATRGDAVPDRSRPASAGGAQRQELAPWMSWWDTPSTGAIWGADPAHGAPKLRLPGQFP